MYKRAVCAPLACVLLSLLASCSDAAFAEEQPATTPWEYALISKSDRAFVDGESWILETGKTFVSADSLEKLVRQVTGTDAKVTTHVPLLNHLGADGWELVSHVVVKDRKTWYLKRPKR